MLIIYSLGVYELQRFAQRKIFVLAAPCSDKFWDTRNLLSSLSKV